MLGENEKQFVESIVNHLSNIAKVQEHLKEHFQILSYYDEDNSTLHLVPQEINESLNLPLAKRYVNSMIDETMLNVVFGGVE